MPPESPHTFVAETRKVTYGLESVETDFKNKVVRIRYRPLDANGAFADCAGGDILWAHLKDSPIPNVPDPPRPPNMSVGEPPITAEGVDARVAFDARLAATKAAKVDFERQLSARREAVKVAEEARKSQHWTDWRGDLRPDAVKAPEFFVKTRSL